MKRQNMQTSHDENLKRIRTWLVEGRAYNWTLIKIYTDTGITGIGEATNWPGSPMIASACEYVAEYLVGEDASRIDFIWSKLYAISTGWGKRRAAQRDQRG